MTGKQAGPVRDVDRLLTSNDLSHQIGIPVKTLYSWHSKGTGPRPLKLGKHLRWRQADVDRWLDQQAH